MDNYPKYVFVDLDGTLIKSDLLLESFLRLLSINAMYLFCIPFWILRGKAFLKHQIAKRAEINVELLPYNDDLLAYLSKQQTEGKHLYLISASNQKFVDQVARYIGIFDKAIGSSDSTNMKGEEKLKIIENVTQGKPFNYAGNEKADLAIWEKSNGAILVHCPGSVAQAANAMANITLKLDQTTHTTKSF